MRKVDFYYDIVSPYSWIAFEVLQKNKAKWQVELNLCPIFLGGIFQTTQNTGPAFIPAKAPYMLKDIHRMADFHNLPMEIPGDFPAKTINTQRFLLALKESNLANKLELLEKFSHELWLRHYGHGETCNLPKDFLEISEKIGLDSQITNTLLEQTQDLNIKAKLKDETQKAVDRGCFGAPTYFLEVGDTEEMFFGADRFDIFEKFLKNS